jgi:hypothetical protein
MNDRPQGIEPTGGTGADWRDLRAALRTLPVPAFDEAEARRAFRAHRRPAQPAAPTRWLRAPIWASAAALVVSLATGTWVVLSTNRSAPDPESPAVAAAAPPATPVAVFQPLPYAPSFSPTGAYSVIRVRIPLSSLVIGHAADVDDAIEADVLLGEDGLARGIRFDAEDTLLVSTISR